MRKSKPISLSFFALSSFRIVLSLIVAFTIAFCLHVSFEKIARYGIFSAVERLYVDHKLRRRPPRELKAPVAIIGIGEESLIHLGRFPFPRSVYAELVERLTKAGADVIAFDILFAEPQTGPIQRELKTLVDGFPAELRRLASGQAYAEKLKERAHRLDDDDRLARAVAHPKTAVVLGYQYNIFNNEGAVEASGAFAHITTDRRREELAKRERFRESYLPMGQQHIAIEETAGAFFLGGEPVLPMSLLFKYVNPAEDHEVRYGFFNAAADYDGIYRKLALVAFYQQRFYPSLSLSAASLHISRKQKPRGSADDHGVHALSYLDANHKAVEIPVDWAGRLWVNFYGNKETINKIPRYELIDVLEGRVPDSELRGKLLFVGTLADTLGDNKATALSASFPGVELNATLAANIIEGSFLYQYPYYFWMGLVSLTLGAALFGWVVNRFNSVLASIFLTVVGVGIVVLDQQVIFPRGLILPVLWVLAEFGSIYLGLTVFKFANTERDKRFIHSAFSRFVSEGVAEQILRDPGRLKLGGEKRELTVLFSDIQGFTEIAEKHDASLVSEYLNAFFTRMTSVLLTNRGTLDKYIGDSIMCFWGAPLAEPHHAELACRTALAMSRELEGFNREWEERLGHPTRIRIGINTGEVSVGNMGSEQIFDYTVLGDNVNLASRLEGVNKDYGTTILVGYRTFVQCSDKFLFRPLDRVQIRGRDEAIEVCELVGDVTESRAALEWVETYARGRAAYVAANWEEARTIFSACIAMNPSDVASANFLKRIAVLEEAGNRTGELEREDGIWRVKRG